MFDISLLLSVFIASGVISYWLIIYALKIFSKKNILDIPNERSNHKTPTPRGAGIAVVFSVLIIWPILGMYYFNSLTSNIIFILLILLLSVISLIDDIKSFSPLIRFIIHLFISGITVFYLLPNENIIIPKFWALNFNIIFVEKLIITLVLTYVISIYNFMDGIDGITAVNTIIVSLFLMIISLVTDSFVNELYLNIIIISSMIIFLFFNWHPAKIFLGDVGSIPLGYIMGYTSLKLAHEKLVIPVIIINLYYLFDSSFTLIKRIINKEKIWEAHSKHIYQQLVRKGFSHSQVVLSIGIIDIILGFFAILIIILNN